MAWSKEQLAALRAKYADNAGGEIFDPRFRKVADRIFDKSGTRAAPYAGVPTFLTAPYRPIDPANPDFGDLQVAIIGRADGPRRHQPLGLALRSAGAARHRTDRPLQPRARLRADP